MTELKPLPLSYGMGNNEFMNQSFNKILNIHNKIKSDDLTVIDDIDKCDIREIITIINAIMPTIVEGLNSDSLDRYTRLSTYIKHIVSVVKNNNMRSDELNQSASILYSKLCRVHAPDPNAEKILTDMICDIKSICFLCNGVDERPLPFSPSNIEIIKNSADAKTNDDILHESASITVSIPSKRNIGGHKNIYIDPETLLKPLFDNSTDEYILAYIENIGKYFYACSDIINEKYINLGLDAIRYTYNRIITNDTGLRKLRSVLLDVKSLLDNYISENFESAERTNHLQGYLDMMIHNIDDRLFKNEKSDISTTDIITEFGFGFMHAFPVEMNDNQVLIMNEVIDANVSDSQVTQFMSDLNESIFSNDPDKAERKNEKREQKKRDRETIKYQGRVMTLTDANARSAMYTLRKIIKGVAVGGPIALFNKQWGIAIGALVMLSSFGKSKLTPSKEKKKIVLELKTELKIVEDKINDMERAGDAKNKAKLMRLQGKMEEVYNRLSTTMYSGDLI